MNNIYVSPLVKRWSSKDMQELWSDDRKFLLWRNFWAVLAGAQMTLGAPITEEQVEELEEHCMDPIDYNRVAVLEKEKRHDVLAHIAHFAEVCPLAKPIIHLAATSCDVTDNVELVQIRESVDMLIIGMARTLDRMAQFARKYKDLPTLGFTHIQAAQPPTVGKRTTMWMADLLDVFNELQQFRDHLMFRGVKGVTGTQASFLALFDGDENKVLELDRLVSTAFGFSRSAPVTGQTYSRNIDHKILSVLAGLGASAHKMCLDLRFLQFLKEVEEPREKDQRGSSGMPYKRNPMRCERACSLGRFLIGQPAMAADTHATQVFERTLDDSAIRRLYLPEAFLAADALLILLQNIFEGLIVYPKMIEKHLREELPFMASEEIIAKMVMAGGDRQECHRRLAVLSLEAGKVVKEQALPNDLLERINKDSYFQPIHAMLEEFVDPGRFIGLAPAQVERFLADFIEPALAPFQDRLEGTTELKV